MYDIIPFLIILLSVIVVLFVLIRKFPALANLDVNTIKAEAETKFKEQIISNRLKRNIAQVYNDVTKIFRPAVETLTNWFKWLYVQLHEARDKYRAEPILSLDDISKKVENLFVQAEEENKADNWDEMERCLIEIIGLESQNIKAFKMLGQVYLHQKNYDDARQTFEHIMRLIENVEEELLKTPSLSEEAIKQKQLELNNDRCLVWDNLSFVASNEENYDEAMDNIKQALSIEPNSPRLLDTLLEISIIKKDKVSALEAHEKLAAVNPENQKLDELMIKIKEL